jgi:hypothetical protein
VTARITGFVTRAQAKLRPPRSVSRNITPDRGGCAVHYGGPAQRLRTHADCIARWRAWQTYHMDTHRWVDIAYTGGFCDHGYAFAGRGLGIRTAANGTNAGNRDYNAFVWLGGKGETPTAAALDALAWWVQQARDHEAGRRVRPHQVFKSTSCPGPHLVHAAAGLDNRPITQTEPTPTPSVQEDEMKLYVFTHQGLDWGTDLMARRPFEDQAVKATWIDMAQRLGHTVERITLEPDEIEALPAVGVGL